MRQRQNSCVIGIRSFAPYPLDWRFRLWPGHHCPDRVGFGRYPSRPATCWVCPGMLDRHFAPGCGSCWIKSGRGPTVRLIACRESISAPQPVFVMRDSAFDTPASALSTSSSKPFCPLSRYRPELQTCSAIERIRPVDGQRLPSAYPAAFAADLKKG